MAQLVRAHTALVEDLDLVPSTYLRQLTAVSNSS